jgi:hypothetical protein
MNTGTQIATLLALALTAGSAAADVTVSQGSSASTYSTTLNFDEAGGPTGVVAPNSWAGIGLADIQSGTGSGAVADVSGIYPWVNSGNAFEGAFGVFMTFDTDLTDFSAQVWDPSGPGSFIGGGMIAVAFHDGIEVGSFFSDAGPAWGGLGDEWWSISGTDGDVFNEVRILGFGFSPTTYIDNVSWNAVPTPSSVALLSFAGVAASRRRR